MSNFNSLSNMQLDALQEIGNICAGNAATALSKLINDRVEMEVPQVKVLSFANVAEIVGGDEAFVSGVYLKISGPAPGEFLFILPVADARQLVGTLLDDQSTSSPESFNQLECSALKELGNILAGAFLNALAICTSFKYFPSVPALCTDMAGSLLEAIFHEIGQLGDHVLFIKTEFHYHKTGQVGGYLFFLPEIDSLELILNTLGVSS